MAKQTSINVQPAKGGSEQHNKREKELDYVRKDLSHLNQYWESDTQANRLATIKELAKAKTGRTIQAKATPIREGVVVIQESTTMEDLHRLADAYRDRLGIEVFQIAIHRDEGHKGSKEWKPNLHAHLVFDWTDHNTGKSVKLNRQKMAEMQTITAEVLGMERGKSSEKKHLTAQQYKAAAETERAEKEAKRAEQLEEQVAELSTTKAAKEATINTIKAIGEKVVDTIKGTKKNLQERIKQLEEELPTEREKGREEGKTDTLQAILNAGRFKLDELKPENIGKRWRMWFDKAKSLEQDVKQLKEETEMRQEQVEELRNNIKALVEQYANGDRKIYNKYAIPSRCSLEDYNRWSVIDSQPSRQTEPLFYSPEEPNKRKKHTNQEQAKQQQAEAVHKEEKQEQETRRGMRR
jgi:hypothetical protein